MTREELDAKIRELTEAANSLDVAERDEQLDEIDMLKIRIAGMALAEITRKLDQIQLPDLQKMDSQIQAAKDATKAYQGRVDAFKIAMNVLKTGIGILI
jgi:uncharacterized coiled-coil DUF342 family protein